MPNKIKVLVDKVEALEWPDWEVDALIAAAVGLPRYQDEEWGDYWLPPKGETYSALVWRRRGRGHGFECPAYTASLDAAMTLVPEGYYVSTMGGREGATCFARIEQLGGGPNDFEAGIGKSIALALVAACLRAKGDEE